MGRARLIGCEEDQVARPQALFGYEFAFQGLCIRGTRQAYPVFGEYVLHITGTVEAVGCGPSENIGHAFVLRRCFQDLGTGHIAAVILGFRLPFQFFVRCVIQVAGLFQFVFFLEAANGLTGGFGKLAIRSARIVAQLLQILLRLLNLPALVPNLVYGFFRRRFRRLFSFLFLCRGSRFRLSRFLLQTGRFGRQSARCCFYCRFGNLRLWCCLRWRSRRFRRFCFRCSLCRWRCWFWCFCFRCSLCRRRHRFWCLRFRCSLCRRCCRFGCFCFRCCLCRWCYRFWRFCFWCSLCRRC